MRLGRITRTMFTTASALLLGSSALLAAPAAVAVSAPAGLEFTPPAAAGAALHPAAAHLTSDVTFANSTNWAGYAATTTKYTSVTSTWR